jgi:hypothetical protein
MTHGPLFEPGQSFALPLWEARWNQDSLRQVQRDSPRMFRRGMQQQPMEDGERLFARGIEKFLRYGVTVAQLLGETDGVPLARRYGGVDPAGETRPGNALTVAALGRSVLMADVPLDDMTPAAREERSRQTRVIVACNLWANQAAGAGSSPYLHTAHMLANAHARHQFATLMLESNATQGSISALTQTVDPSIPFDHVTTGANKQPELEGLAVEMERGLWALCMDDAYDTRAPLKSHDALCACAYCALREDVVAYPDPSRGKYDSLMSLLFCWTAMRRAGAAPGIHVAGSSPESTRETFRVIRRVAS